jgi:hypothetical protein
MIGRRRGASPLPSYRHPGLRRPALAASRLEGLGGSTVAAVGGAVLVARAGRHGGL